MARITYPVEPIGIGTPDYSPVQPPGQISPGPIYTLTDMGELAARLGSIVTHDRRGNVIWLDDFESGIQSWIGSGDPGYAVTWEGNYSRNGGFCCKLVTDTDAGDEAHIERAFGYPVLSKCGLEFSIAYLFNCKYLLFRLDMQTTAGLYEAEIRYASASHSFEYLGDDGLYHAIPDIVFEPIGGRGQFNTLKVVIGYPSQEYVRLIVDNQKGDLTGLPCDYTGGVAIPYAKVKITIVTLGLGVATAYIDDVIVTQNEPPND